MTAKEFIDKIKKVNPDNFQFRFITQQKDEVTRYGFPNIYVMNPFMTDEMDDKVIVTVDLSFDVWENELNKFLFFFKDCDKEIEFSFVDSNNVKHEFMLDKSTIFFDKSYSDKTISIFFEEI